jgi:hypothetical protein
MDSAKIDAKAGAGAGAKAEVGAKVKVKVKVNDRCPCDSGLKYKKCCARADQQTKLAKAEEYTEILLANERQTQWSDRLQNINTYFLERYHRPSINITEIATSETIGRISQYYSTKNIFLVCDRNATTENAFTSKGAKTGEDVMVIYKNKFLQFNWEDEKDQAYKEIHKWM